MSSFFNMDSPLFRFLGRLADIMILNIIFLITCIPIVTIGAAWTALSYVSLKMARNEESYIIRSYFKSFKQNFKQSTIIWLITLFLGMVFYVDFKVINTMDGSFKTFMLVAIGAIAFIVLMTTVYVYPVLAKFDNSVKNTIKNAFIMAVCNLPRTIVILIIFGGSVFLTFINGFTISYGLLIWLMGGFGIVAFFTSKLFVKIFDPYIPEESDSDSAEEVPVDSSVFKNLSPVSAKETENSENIETNKS